MAEPEKKEPWWKETSEIIRAGGAVVGGIAVIAGTATVLGTVGAVVAGVAVVGTAGVIAYQRIYGKASSEGSGSGGAVPAVPSAPATPLTLAQKRNALAKDLIGLRDRAKGILNRIDLLDSDEKAKTLVHEYWDWNTKCKKVLNERLSAVEADDFIRAPKPRRYDSKLNYQHKIRDYKYKREAPAVFEMAETLTAYVKALEALIQETGNIDESRLV